MMVTVPFSMDTTTTSVEKRNINKTPIRYGKLSSSDYFDNPVTYSARNQKNHTITEYASTLQNSDFVKYLKSMGIKIGNEDDISHLLDKNKKVLSKSQIRFG